MDIMYLPQGRYQLTLIDDCTRLTGATVLASRTMQAVLAVLPHLLEAFPFPLRCIQTGNGSEFINGVLVSWCMRERISLTRGRGYRKNDQAYVEQRNWLGVRRQVGYHRYSSRAAFEALQQLYPLLRLQLNFFRPVRKLVGKERIGATVVKRYDEPRTPYQRLLAAGALHDTARAQLRRQYLAANPAELQRASTISCDTCGVWGRQGPTQQPPKPACRQAGWVTVLMSQRFLFGNTYL